MKENLRLHTMMYPAPAVVASAYDSKGKADACTLAFASMCSHRPPAVMIAINTTLKRKTLASILESKEFCLGFPSVEHVAEVDYLGIASGYDVDKLKEVNFTHQKGEYVNAPIINEFRASLECKVIDINPVGSHTQITGEIVNVQAEKSIMDEKGKILFDKLNPLGYDDITHSYYEIGPKIADAFKAGKKFLK